MKTLQALAYQHLKELITNHRLDYGTIYSETKVSQELGISRTPMRDAIHRLAQEKYLDIIPSRGFMLHRMTSTDVIEIFQTRSAIEGYCTLQIASRCQGSAEQQLFSTLEQLLERQRSTDDIEAFVDLDNRFHLEIVRFLNNSSFNETFDSLIAQIRQLAIMSLSHEGRREETCQEHRAILQAMKDGDTEHVYQITQIHMEKPLGINLSDL
ncbi:MAG: GntR family transcriptional regulator [Firmicutes bacterium]|nr:GntR family transcriptional regulator [Bacillota bacterium]